MTALNDVRQSARLLADPPGDRMPVLGIANYGAIPSVLAEAPPTLVSVVGSDRASNWAGLSREAERDRRARWLDTILAAVDRAYPGFAASVTEKVLLTARSMEDYLNTPEREVYGFAPRPPERSFWAGLPRSARTPIAGLYLASAFGASGGFTGAMLSGAGAAGLALANPR
jgi:phytoene dehydrogenase-like protein